MFHVLSSCYGREPRSLLNTFPFNAADLELPARHAADPHLAARQGADTDNLVDFASVAEASAAGRRCIDKVRCICALKKVLIVLLKVL